MAFNPRNGAAAYQQQRAAGSIEDADPHRLTGLLFDGFVDCVNRARGHMGRGEIPEKGRQITRAIAMAEELQRALDPSVKASPLPARLGALYTYIQRRLLEANLHNDPAALDECLRLIQPIREAWAAIRPQYLAERQQSTEQGA